MKKTARQKLIKILKKNRKCDCHERSELDLSGIDFEASDLSHLNLNHLNFSQNSLRLADLSHSNLIQCRFNGSNLSNANLEYADVTCSSFVCAMIRGASFANSDLTNAVFNEACLTGANFENAEMTGARLDPYRIVPEEGEFYAWKALAHGHIAKILIPSHAVRISVPTSRKCRASMIFIITIYDKDGKETKGSIPCHSYRCRNNCYEPNKTYETELNPDIRLECTKGLHFFMTKQEAIDW